MVKHPLVRDTVWRHLTNFWSFVVFAAVIYDFKTDNGLGDFLPSILVVYVAFLTIYVSCKEFERWYQEHANRHPGELFVLAWTALLVGIIAAQVALQKPYQMPGEVLSTYIAVLSILAITQKSRSLNQRHRSKNFI